MRNVVSLVCLLVLLGVSLPAQAQLRETALEQHAPSKLYDTSKSSGFTLNKLFDPAHFRMSQSAEFSSSSFAGRTTSLGMFTNSMMWQFNDKMAARMDVSVAYSPNSGTLSNPSGNLAGGNTQVFIRNAEFAYRPSENVQLHISYQQSPYGAYGSPFGYYGYSPYGHRARYMSASFGRSHDLFWNDGER